MRMTSMHVLLAVALLAVSGNAFAADRVQAGQWETKMTMGAGQPVVSQYCITAAEAKFMNADEATLRKYLEQSTAEKTKGRCKVKSVSVSDNRTVVTMVCGKSEVTGTTTYHGDHYESTSSNNTTITGRRLGACK